MSYKKIKFIIEYLTEHAEDDLVFLKLHSLFNCLSEEEISHLYFTSLNKIPTLQKTLESYIIKRTINEPLRKFDKIAKALLETYPEKDYKIQIATRTFITQFVRTLSSVIIRMFYDIMINSERKIDRRRGGEVADLIWSDEVEKKLLDNYHKYKDEDSLVPLINSLKSTDLCRLMEKNWTPNFPSYRLKNAILEKIDGDSIVNLMFLKEVEPFYFVQVMVRKKLKIDNATLNKLIKLMTNENKHYLVWQLGLTGNWDLVVKFLDT